jgi:hypothetical protein
MYNNKGLYYHVVDENGKKIGAPVKASAFRQPVTLPHLEEKFRLNQEKVREEAQYMRTRIDNCIYFATENCSLAMLKEDLMKENIHIVVDPAQKVTRRSSPPLRKSLTPRTPTHDGHGFFYVDHHARFAVGRSR